MNPLTSSGTAARSAPPLSVYPLDELYAHTGLRLPAIEPIAGESMPEPYRSLLVHQRDMTPTLEAFHRSDIHIEVLRRERRDGFYFREVVLRLDESERPVEFGANKIDLKLFTPEAHWMILQEKVPLGRILKDHAVPHVNRPQGFFRLASDALMNRVFRLGQGTMLYGRKAKISDLEGRSLSEIVEILPPMKG